MKKLLYEFEITFLTGDFIMEAIFAESYIIAWQTLLNKLYRRGDLTGVVDIRVIR
jgi:hypothetical protein